MRKIKSISLFIFSILFISLFGYGVIRAKNVNKVINTHGLALKTYSISVEQRKAADAELEMVKKLYEAKAESSARAHIAERMAACQLALSTLDANDKGLLELTAAERVRLEGRQGECVSFTRQE